MKKKIAKIFRVKKLGKKSKEKKEDPTRSGGKHGKEEEKKEAVKCVLNLHYCHLELERYFVWFPDSQRELRDGVCSICVCVCVCVKRDACHPSCKL
jgi:hypothetical protein